MATGGISKLDVTDSYLIRRALHVHFDNLCKTIKYATIMDSLYSREFLDETEYENIKSGMAKLDKPTSRARFLLEKLMEKNDSGSQLIGVMSILKEKHPEIYETLCSTMTDMIHGKTQSDKMSETTGKSNNVFLMHNLERKKNITDSAL